MTTRLAVRSLVALIGCGVWGLGCDAPTVLLVDLRTDYVPGVEFSTVVVELLAPDAGFDAPRVEETRVYAVESREPFFEGVRVAEIEEVAPGPRRILVRLSDADGEVLAEIPLAVTVRGAHALTVKVTRDCAGVVCPAEGGDANAITCVGGRCVDPGCTPETPEACPTPVCTADAQCEGATDACARPVCDEGVCLVAPVADACGSGLVCHPTRGCVATDATLLEIDAPASVNLGTEATIDARGGREPYTFSLVEGEAELDPASGRLIERVYYGQVRVRVTDAAGSAQEASVRIGGDALFFVGGRVGTDRSTGYVDTAYRSDDDGETWVEVGALPGPRYNPTVLVRDDAMHLLGGRSGELAWHDEVFRSTDGVTWTDVGRDAVPRAAASLTWFDGRYWNLGGFDADRLRDDVATSLDGVDWTASAALPRPIYGGAVFPLDGRLHYLGGQTSAGAGTDAVMSTVDGVAWETSAAVLPFPCYFGGFALHRGVAYVGAGADCEGQIAASDDRLASFRVAADLGDAREGAAMVVHRDALVLAGGAVEAVLTSDDGAVWVETGALPVALNGGRLFSFTPP